MDGPCAAGTGAPPKADDRENPHLIGFAGEGLKDSWEADGRTLPKKERLNVC